MAVRPVTVEASGEGKGGDRPPRKAVPSPSGRSSNSPPSRGLESRLAQFFATPSIAFYMRGDEFCGDVVANGAPQLAAAWANLAKESPTIKKMLERILEGGAWGGVIYSSMAIAIPILAHHGMAPPEAAALFVPNFPAPAETGGEATGAGGAKADPAQPPPAPGAPPTVTRVPRADSTSGASSQENGAGSFVPRIPPDQSGVGHPSPGN